jgi:predicted N-formylglutamate amidohydrolase
MENPWKYIGDARQSPILIIADHASNRIPDGIELGIEADLLSRHIAWDIGVADLAERLCAKLDCTAILGNVSRLVIDFNREEDAAGLIPVSSDGHDIPGNRIDATERTRRIAQYWQAYHNCIDDYICRAAPKLLVSLHSFTPQLQSDPAQMRPWQIGILYNQDDRAARIALPLLDKAGVVAGDQLPYSGMDLNATMNHHGEGNGIAYLGIEMRQDEIGDVAGQEIWAEILTPIIQKCLAGPADASLRWHDDKGASPQRRLGSG